MWKPIVVDSAVFCNCDYMRPILIRVYEHRSNGNHRIVGEFKTNTSKLLQDKNTEHVLQGEKSKGALIVKSCTFREKASFLQFIQSGLELNFMIAIDFTGSNGNPSAQTSLHYANPNNYARGILNQYEKAIYSIGNTIEYYDKDRLFPVYGFGGVLPGTTTANHCFPLNGNMANPEVYGIDGVMSIYHTMLTQVKLSGPTLFEPLLITAKNICENIRSDKSKYLVLLIITDGTIHDMEDTIALLCSIATYPISVLIVGVGNDDFENMEILDGDNTKLSSQGKTISRDIVQFVAMKDMNQSSPEMIAQQLLAEIPRQVTEYMSTNQITPSMLLHSYLSFF